ncbi:MAG: TRAM domain-containing protein [Gemmatimonadota bacterium]
MAPRGVARGERRRLSERVRIDRIAAGGAGVGRLADGRVVFVARSAPGDEIEVEVTEVKKKWAKAIPIRVVHPGPDRAPPPCVHYARCGGCALQHLEADAQLGAKRAIVEDALSRIGGRAVPVEAAQPAPQPFGYRVRAQFHLRRLAGGRVVAGFHAVDRPGRVVDIPSGCLILDPVVERAWTQIRGAWGPGACRLPGGAALRLAVRRVEGGVVLTVEGGRGRGEPDALLADAPAVRALWSRPERGAARLLAGDPDVAEADEAVSPLGPGAFTQVNPSGAEVLEQWVVGAAGGALPGARVIDAYAGAGLFGRALAALGARVQAIEADPVGAAAARRAGLAVLEGRVEARLREALPADLVVVDPPRAGLDPAVADLLERSGPPRLIYVSCDPATLARDLARLGRYRASRVRVLDLFPQTAHVETVVTLDREGAEGDLPAVPRASPPDPSEP